MNLQGIFPELAPRLTSDRNAGTLHRMRPELEEAFANFCNKVHARLQQGARTYGDASLEMPTPRLVNEIQQELEDVAGWSILLWMRLERLRRTHENIRARFEEDGA